MCGREVTKSVTRLLVLSNRLAASEHQKRSHPKRNRELPIGPFGRFVWDQSVAFTSRHETDRVAMVRDRPRRIEFIVCRAVAANVGRRCFLFFSICRSDRERLGRQSDRCCGKCTRHVNWIDSSQIATLRPALFSEKSGCESHRLPKEICGGEKSGRQLC